MERGERERLPMRRARTEGVSAKVDGRRVHMRTGLYADGRVGELFLWVARAGSMERGFATALAVATSIGLQYGAPLSAYVDRFTNMRFEPYGVVTGHDRIHMAASIPDLVFRELGITYGGREDLAHDG